MAVIERLARRKDVRRQFHFAREAKALIPACDDVLLAKSHRGLHLLGLEERSLRLPAGMLLAAYGSSVVIEPPSPGKPRLEFRVGFERCHLRPMRSALSRRGVNPSEEYDGVHYCVLRFEAAPATLLGLPVQLAELTSGRVSQQILLRGYQ